MIKTPRSILRQRKRMENVRINSSTSDWTMELESKKLKMNMVDLCSFDSLIKPRENPESQALMAKAADAFDGNDYYAREFERLVKQLSQNEIHVDSSPEVSDESLESDPAEALDLSSSNRHVTFINATVDAEMADTTANSPGPCIDSASDDSDSALWSNGSNQVSPHLDKLTSNVKDKFIGLLSPIFSDATGMYIQASYDPRTVNTGTSRFSSSNDGRYHFCLPDQKHVGGAELFGTETKCRGTSTTKNHKEKLQIQVAGEMLATVMHRDVFLEHYPKEGQILKACPNLERLPTETSRTVYYLVFTHLSLRISKAVFGHTYLRDVAVGTLPKDSSVDIMWSPRLRLNDRDDLRKAARLVMCLLLTLKDEFDTGLHYWVPFRENRAERAAWITN